MSFQAYIDNIYKKTGKMPADFKRLALDAGLLDTGVKPAQLIAWLKVEFGLEHNYAMAIYATLKGELPGAAQPGMAKARAAAGENALPKLSAPAQRALAGAGIENLQQLARISEASLAALHGIGPNAIRQLREALSDRGMTFKR